MSSTASYISASTINGQPFNFQDENETLYSVMKKIEGLVNFPINKQRIVCQSNDGRMIKWYLDKKVVRILYDKTADQEGEVYEYDISKEDASPKIASILLKLDPGPSNYSLYPTLDLAWRSK